jgi:hypothetical protein
MPIPTYTLGYPPDGSSLGQTKAVIRNNLDGTFQTLGIDHVNNNGQPGSQPAGYHTVSHLVPQGVDPAPVTGYGQLYSKTVNSFTTDQALFWETGTGIIQQLTTNITPSATVNGYSFLPGGILIQWMKVNNPITGTTYNFPVAFPNTCFSIQLTPSLNNNSTIRCYLASGTLSASGFQIQATSSSNFTSMYVTAIGN